MNLRRSIAFSATAFLVALAGCKPDAAVKTAATINSKTSSSPAAPAGPPADAGEIKGVVRFSGKAPARVPIDMSMDPGCSTAGENLSEQLVINGGKLANVYIYVKSGAPPTQIVSSTPAVILDQKGCRYTPHVIAVQQGGSVEFHSSDPTMHNIHITPVESGNSTIDVSQAPMGLPQTRQFNAPEPMIAVRCNNHPWMSAFINVAPNQFFAVSAPDGSFTIRGLPPGSYTLAAIHEKLGEQDMQITVPARSTAAAEYTFGSK